jgi:hypothetical protein
VAYNVAFGNLYQACQKHALRASLHTFDGGQKISIVTAMHGHPVFDWSSEWGDKSPVDEAAEYLVEKGFIKAADLEG